jgi:hypothetical protein
LRQTLKRAQCCSCCSRRPRRSRICGSWRRRSRPSPPPASDHSDRAQPRSGGDSEDRPPLIVGLSPEALATLALSSSADDRGETELLLDRRRHPRSSDPRHVRWAITARYGGYAATRIAQTSRATADHMGSPPLAGRRLVVSGSRDLSPPRGHECADGGDRARHARGSPPRPRPARRPTFRGVPRVRK